MPPTVTFLAGAATSKPSQHSIYTRPQKKQKMSITQTYFLAHSARGKLSKEAARADHDLRLLVGHANMLDSLMLDLANAEQEQERWFNNIVSPTHAAEADDEHEDDEEEAEAPRRVETIEEEPEANWDAEDVKEPTNVTAVEVDSDMEEDDEDDADLTLIRTASRHSPPELSLDTDSSDSDEDEQMPPSPPTSTVLLSERQRQAIATTSFYDLQKPAPLSAAESEALEHDGFYLPSRDQPTIIAAF